MTSDNDKKAAVSIDELIKEKVESLLTERLVEINAKARAEVIEEVKLELLKLVEGLSDPEPYVEFNDVINILTKLERGAE